MTLRARNTRRVTLGAAVLLAGAGAGFAALGACAGQTSDGNGGFTGGSSSSGSGGNGASSSGGTSSSSSSGTGQGSSSSSGAPGSSSSSSSGGTSSGTTTGSSSGSQGIADAGGDAGALCGTKVVVALSNPVLQNFDSYTGTTALLTGSTFGPAFPAGGYTGLWGPYASTTGVADGVLSMVTGRTGGVLPDGGTDWAVDLSVMPEAQYNNGIGIWMSCANATAFKGISFWVRGQMPTFQLSVVLATLETSPLASGGPCTGTCASPTASSLMDAGLPVTFPVWTQVTLPWSAFTGGLVAGAAFTPAGDNITGLVFSPFNIAYPPVDASADGSIIYGQVPNNLDLQIDDIEFMP